MTSSARSWATPHVWLPAPPVRPTCPWLPKETATCPRCVNAAPSRSPRAPEGHARARTARRRKDAPQGSRGAPPIDGLRPGGPWRGRRERLPPQALRLALGYTEQGKEKSEEEEGLDMEGLELYRFFVGELKQITQYNKTFVLVFDSNMTAP